MLQASQKDLETVVIFIQYEPNWRDNISHNTLHKVNNEQCNTGNMLSKQDSLTSGWHCDGFRVRFLGSEA